LEQNALRALFKFLLLIAVIKLAVERSQKIAEEATECGLGSQQQLPTD
jgi:hypothetical protein